MFAEFALLQTPVGEDSGVQVLGHVATIIVAVSAVVVVLPSVWNTWRDRKLFRSYLRVEKKTIEYMETVIEELQVSFGDLGSGMEELKNSVNNLAIVLVESKLV